MVYYLKYRPQKIDDLDNEDVRKTLTAVLSSNTPPHAFLFTGPKGLGKTSSARIVAKVLNCEKRAKSMEQGAKSKTKDQQPKINDQLEPCNQCEMCLSITKGTNLDVLEIDAASNRGIDEIRDLREKIRLAPVFARKKVYIIDEVHMLTTEAFNALLKTLEEPPPHAVFILATTEPQKVPDTIKSRCLHINFHKATDEELLRSFQRIVDGEKLEIGRESLAAIATLADGGFRDGVKVLEELVLASNGEPITKEMIEKTYHMSSNAARISVLLTSLGNNDLKAAIAQLEEIAKEGSDLQLFLKLLLEELHKVLLTLVAKEKTGAVSGLTLTDLQLLLPLLQQAHAQMRSSSIPQLPLELAVTSFIEERTAVDAAGAAGGNVRHEQPHDDKSIHSFRKQVGELQKQRAITGEKDEEKVKRKSANGASLTSYNATGAHTEEWLASFWQSYIDKLKEYNHTISGVLRGCKLRSFDRKTLVIETAYKFHKDRLTEGKTLTALEEAAKVLAGNQVTVTIELKTS